MGQLVRLKMAELVLVVLFPSLVVADGSDDFSNNLFSDLAPILTLFGDQVAKQFMSQSMGWADNILFAMAPLGIITAIVGAIRVGGPTWLKAIIGRARESKATVEMELLSSTSHDVCELWNGQTIVRMMGAPPLLELLYFPGLRNEANCGLYTLDEAKADGLIYQDEKGANTARYSRYIGFLQNPRIPATRPQIDEEAPQNDGNLMTQKIAAPNIFLNLRPERSRREIHVFAVLSILIQLLVLVFSGLITYQPALKFKKHGMDVVRYAYPLTTLGTFVVVLGMLICSFTIEQSTNEVIWRVNFERLGKLEGFKDGQSAIKENLWPRLLWIQQGASINDETFDSYAIFAQGARKSIITSRLATVASTGDTPFFIKLLGIMYQKPSNDKPTTPINFTVSNFSQIVVTVGTIISVCGFVVQFTGLRAMHWSASIAQLIATLIMTGVRAWVRRDLTLRPSAQSTPHGHELDWLATRLADNWEDLWLDPIKKDFNENGLGEFRAQKCYKWGIITGSGVEKQRFWTHGKNIDYDSVHRVVMIRQRIGKLSKWVAGHNSSILAISVANSIEIVMNTLFPLERYRGSQKLHWCIPGCQNKKLGLIKLSVKRGTNGLWIANTLEIEAVLSLWLYAARIDEQVQSDSEKGSLDSKDGDWLRYGNLALRKSSIRLLGPDREHYRRDLNWFINSDRDDLIEKIEELPFNSEGSPEYSSEDIITVDSHRVVGFKKLKEEAQNAPDSTTKRIFKRLERFPEEIGQKSELQVRVDFNNEYQPESGQCDNSQPIGGERGGTNSSYLAIISETSLEMCLAQELFATFMWAAAKLTLPLVGDTIIRPISLSDSTIISPNHFKLENITLRRITRDIERTGLGTLEDIYIATLPPLIINQKLFISQCLFDYAMDMALRHESLGRLDEACNVYIWLSKICRTLSSDDVMAVRAVATLAEFTQVICETAKLQDLQLLESTSVNIRNLKLLLMSERDKIDSKLSNLIQTLYSVQGRVGWWGGTKLDIGENEIRQADYLGHWSDPHYQVVNGSFQDNKLSYEQVNLADILGWTPLHYAVALKMEGIVAKLLDVHSADPQREDLMGWTPLHYGAWSGNESICWNLLKGGAKLSARGREGITALHCAAQEGHCKAIKLFLGAGADVNVQDKSRRTPLHWAAYKGQEEAIKTLLGKEANILAQDENGRTPLHLAILGGVHVYNAKIITLLGGSKESLSTKDRKLQNALHLAAISGNEKSVSTLVGLGVEDKEEDQDGLTALSHAVISKNIAIVKIFANHSPNLRSKDNENRTILHRAIEDDSKEIFEILMRTGFEVYSKDPITVNIGIRVAEKQKVSIYSNALHAAIGKGDVEIVRMLLERGLDISRPGTIQINRNVDVEREGKLNLYTNTVQVAVATKNHKILELLPSYGNLGAKSQGNITVNGVISIRNGGEVNVYAGLQDMITINGDISVNKNCKINIYTHVLQTAAVFGQRESFQLLSNYGYFEPKPKSRGNITMNGVIGIRDGGEVSVYTGPHDTITINGDIGVQNKSTINIYGNLFHTIVRTSDVEVVKLFLSRDHGSKKKFKSETSLIFNGDFSCRYSTVNIYNRLPSKELVRFMGETSFRSSNVIFYLDPLHVCVKNSSVEILKLLLKDLWKGNGKAIELYEFGGKPFIDNMSRLGVLANTLLSAVHNNASADILRLLLESNEMAFSVRQKAQALSIAVNLGYEPLVEIFLEHGVGGETEEGQRYGPELLAAALSGHWGIVRILIENGAPVNVTDDNSKKTALHAAAEKGHDHTAKILIAKGVDIEASDEYGRRPLHLAASNDRISMATLLLQNGADINAKDNQMSTPLHNAVSSKNEAMVSFLLDNAASVTATMLNGQTALHLAVLNRTELIIPLLIRLGAVTEAQDEFGETPFQLAKNSGYESVARYFESPSSRGAIQIQRVEPTTVSDVEPATFFGESENESEGDGRDKYENGLELE